MVFLIILSPENLVKKVIQHFGIAIDPDVDRWFVKMEAFDEENTIVAIGNYVLSKLRLYCSIYLHKWFTRYNKKGI